MGWSQIGKDALHLGGMSGERGGEVAVALLYLDAVLPPGSVDEIADLSGIGFDLVETIDVLVLAYGGGITLRWTDEALRARGRR